MENQILDEPEIQNKNKFSKRAFWIFVVTVFVFGFIGYLFKPFTLGKATQSENYWLFEFLSYLSIVAFVLPFIGFSFSIKSFKRKEKGVLMWIAFIGNLIFCLIIALILFANVLDIVRGLN